jgi:hypothetical protein
MKEERRSTSGSGPLTVESEVTFSPLVRELLILHLIIPDSIMSLLMELLKITITIVYQLPKCKALISLERRNVR